MIVVRFPEGAAKGLFFFATTSGMALGANGGH
jgi:hypothetical protein